MSSVLERLVSSLAVVHSGCGMGGVVFLFCRQSSSKYLVKWKLSPRKPSKKTIRKNKNKYQIFYLLWAV